jgi:branched-chain amino acid transport system permease protein
MTFQVLINGLALGAVYALIGTGFSIIFNVLKFSNFAHGAMMTFSAFAGYYIAASKGLGLIPTIIAAVITGSLIAVIGEFIAFRRITLRNTSPIYFFVSSITLGALLEGIITVKVGANFYNYPRFFENAVVKFGNFIVSTSDLLMLIFSAVGLVILLLVIQKTKMGRALRAVSFDRDTANLMGINVTRIIQFTFSIAGSLAGLAGVFLGINYTLYPTLGSLVVKGFIASVIGGLGSLGGAIAGAIALGFLETILIHLVGSGYAPIFIFFIMLAFLLIRPQGISGSNVQEKA